MVERQKAVELQGAIILPSERVKAWVGLVLGLGAELERMRSVRNVRPDSLITFGKL